MIKMKKIASFITAAAIAACMMVPASANTVGGQSDINLYVPNDPIYTVTIPSAIELDGTAVTDVALSASDVQYIPEGKKISVTLTQGSGKYGRLYLAGTDETGKERLMTLRIKGASDTEYKSGALEKQIKGMELVSFTDNGSASYQMYPASLDYDKEDGNLHLYKGVEYKGYIVYGVALADTTEA